MRKFYIFNGIVFLILVIIFGSASSLENYINYTFSGNSWLNPVNGAYYYFTGMILQIFSALGIIVQLIFVNIKLGLIKKA